MITKGIISEVIDNYCSKVRIPIYHRAEGTANCTPNKDLPIAYYCAPPGITPAYKPGEIVYVDFELDQPESPVILGSLCRNNSNSSCNIDAQSVNIDIDMNVPDSIKEYLDKIKSVNYK